MLARAAFCDKSLASRWCTWKWYKRIANGVWGRYVVTDKYRKMVFDIVSELPRWCNGKNSLPVFVFASLYTVPDVSLRKNNKSKATRDAHLGVNLLQRCRNARNQTLDLLIRTAVHMCREISSGAFPAAPHRVVCAWDGRRRALFLPMASSNAQYANGDTYKCCGVRANRNSAWHTSASCTSLITLHSKIKGRLANLSVHSHCASSNAGDKTGLCTRRR